MYGKSYGDTNKYSLSYTCLFTHIHIHPLISHKYTYTYAYTITFTYTHKHTPVTTYTRTQPFVNPSFIEFNGKCKFWICSDSSKFDLMLT